MSVSLNCGRVFAEVMLTIFSSLEDNNAIVTPTGPVVVYPSRWLGKASAVLHHTRLAA